MAKKFLSTLKIVNLPSDPTVGSEGELYFNTSASVAKIYQAGAWSVLGAGGGGGGTTTVSTTEPESSEIGDSWYKNDTGEFYIYDGTYWVEVNGVIEGLSQEQVQDYVAPLFTSASTTNITAVYDDINNVINLNTSGSLVSIDSISSPDFIQFDTTANITPVTGLLGWDSVEGTLNLGLSSTKHIHLGEESVYRVRNSTGSTISKGTALYASGVESSGRIQVTPYVADGSVREVRFMGLATESISNGINGFVQHFGYVRDLDTRGTSSTAISVGDETWGAGDILYVHPTVPGKLTNVKPTHAVVVAIIIIRHQTTGILFVRPSSGGHLEDIHDILISGSVQNNEILAYDLSNGVWANKTASEAGLATTSDLSNYLTISSASTNYATKTYADNAASSASAAAVSYLVDSAPSTLDTLNELAAALGDDANFASTVTTALGNKLDASTASSTYLTQLSASTTYQPIGSYSLSSHNHTLDSLSNVDINSLTDGDAIIWSSASSAWVNQVAQGGATTTVSETAPATPSTGDSWYKPSNGSFFIYDGSYWVEVTSVITMSDEEAQDKVSSLFVHSNHSNITATYDDANNEIILTSSATPDLSSYLTQASASTIYAPISSPTFTGSVTIGEAITKTTSTALTSASATTIATFPAGSALSAECLVVFSSENSGAQTTSKVLIAGDDGNGTVDITEYAIIQRDGGSGIINSTISASLSGGNILLRATVSNYEAVTAKVVSTHILSPIGSS
jgi:hypothetical protein